LQQNEQRAALKDFSAAAQQLRCEPTAYVFLGITYRQLGDLPQALTTLRRAADLFAQDISAHEDQGGLVLARQKVAVVEQARMLLELGRVYRAQNAVADSQPELERAIKLTHTAAGVTADQQAQLDAVYTDASFELGLLAYDQGDMARAAAQFATSATLYEVLGNARCCAEANYYLGLAHTPTRPDAAQIALKKARKLLAGSPPDDELRRQVDEALAMFARPAPPDAPA
jgi:tetratricopeptide (TPR) repeat protein